MLPKQRPPGTILERYALNLPVSVQKNAATPNPAVPRNMFKHPPTTPNAGAAIRPPMPETPSAVDPEKFAVTPRQRLVARQNLAKLAHDTGSQTPAVPMLRGLKELKDLQRNQPTKTVERSIQFLSQFAPKDRQLKGNGPSQEELARRVAKLKEERLRTLELLKSGQSVHQPGQHLTTPLLRQRTRIHGIMDRLREKPNLAPPSSFLDKKLDNTVDKSTDNNPSINGGSNLDNKPSAKTESGVQPSVVEGKKQEQKGEMGKRSRLPQPSEQAGTKPLLTAMERLQQLEGKSKKDKEKPISSVPHAMPKSGPTERLQALAASRSKLFAPIAEEDEFKPKKSKQKDPAVNAVEQKPAPDGNPQVRTILSGLPMRPVRGKRLSMCPFPQTVEADAKQSEFVVPSPALTPLELPRRDGRSRQVAQHLPQRL
jgi:hypothetical protein